MDYIRRNDIFSNHYLGSYLYELVINTFEL
jgi:hypothetical protein